MALLLVALTPAAVIAAPPVGSTYSVSEQSGGFSWSGVNRVDDFSSYGDGGHFFWTYASPYNGANCFGGGQDSGTWTTGLPSAGYYELQVFIPGRNAGTNNAVYQITTTGGVQPVSVNQALYFGWVSLGIHHVSQGRLFLPDITGEACGTKKVGYDTARWIYRGQVGSPDKGRGGTPGDATPPAISSPSVFRTPSDRPFQLNVRVTADDRSRGNSPVVRLMWGWEGKPLHPWFVPQPRSYLPNYSFPIYVFESSPNKRDRLRVQAVDAAGNVSGTLTVDYRLPMAPVYVAMGDSFPSGHHGLTKPETNDSSYGYPRYVRDKLPRSPGGWTYLYYNIARAGSSTTHVRNGQVGNAVSALRARQGSWNVVTLGVGADDTTWLYSLLTWYAARLAGERRGCPPEPAVPDSISGAIADILRQVRNADPNAYIIVTGYPNPFPKQNPCHAGAAYVVGQLNSRIEAGRLQVTRVAFANYYEAFKRASGDPHPFIQQTLRGFPHPNSYGHQVIANEVWRVKPWT